MKKLALILIALILNACGVESRAPNAREYYRELQGQWQSPCVDFLGSFRIQRMKFENLKLTTEERIYSDSACVLQQSTLVTNSYYDIGVAMDRILERSIQIFFRVDDVTMILTDSQAVADYNANSTCGFNDWAINTPKDVSGRQCESGEKVMPTVDDQYLNLIRLVDNILSVGNDRCEIDNSCIVYYGQKYPREYYPWGLQKVP